MEGNKILCIFFWNNILGRVYTWTFRHDWMNEPWLDRMCERMNKCVSIMADSGFLELSSQARLYLNHDMRT